MLGSPAGSGGASQRGLWPIAPAPAPPPSGFATDGFGRYGIYSLFPGGPNLGGALYSHANAIGRFASGIPPSSGIPPTSGIPFHAAHKDSIFSTAGYTFGTATPPLGSPYPPVVATQLEFLTKGFNSNIIIQPDFSISPKKLTEERCEDKCYQIKSETSCDCQVLSHKKFGDVTTGCSRTNPIKWSPINIKKELSVNPCQVSEITTSGSPVVKIEVTSPTEKVPELSITTMPSMATTNGNIPVGIAVARQRVQHNEILSSPSLPPTGLLTTVNTMTHLKEIARLTETDSTPGMAANMTGGIPGGGALLQCTEDRTAGLAGWSLGGSHNSLATPTLWQYPAALPIEPMVPLPVPVPPVGVQLVRDPTSGQLLLLPTTGIEQIQQAVVWPSYQQHPPVLLPPLPPPPLQLLTSTPSDYFSTNATLHQHTQTQSTRLLAVTTTDSKRKIPLPIPATTLIKIEADSTALEHSKSLQAVSTIGASSAVLADQNIAPLVTTHLIYQHPTNLILPASSGEASSRSQATSPVVCLTPPAHETVGIVEDEAPGVQDASNQTDILISSEDDATMHPIVEVVAEAKLIHKENIVTEDNSKPNEIPLNECENLSKNSAPIVTPDLSGLQLLSNSIDAHESSSSKQESANKDKLKHTADDKLIGLDLLCALAEQRIREEDIVKTTPCTIQETRKKKRKSKYKDERKLKKLKVKDFKLIDSSFENSDHRSYKSRESEEGVQKFLASMSQQCHPTGKWCEMNSNEFDMRIKMAKLQEKYKKTKKQLSKLKPRTKSTEEKDVKHQSSKRYIVKDVTPPPLIDKMDVVAKPDNIHLHPPTLTLAKVESYKVLATNFAEQSFGNNVVTENTKKRKTVTPKKSPQHSYTSLQEATETLVSKKLSTGFVSRLMAAKQKLAMENAQTKSSSPPRYIDDSNMKELHKSNKLHKTFPTIKKKHKKSSKMRPKLKAEVTIKPYSEDDDVVEESEPVVEPDLSMQNELVCKEIPKQVDDRCILLEKHLEMDKLRVLIVMRGLFYAGCLNALRPPDVYSITLDGERGNRPNIFSREEILRDTIVEVSPASTKELTIGARVCAYWSQQYRCLYPGSIAEPGSPDPALDNKFATVEFDDGDSGRINIDDIRLLPTGYPIMEYDPNPLNTLCKRRRRTSAASSEEQRLNQSVMSPPSTTTILEHDEEKPLTDTEIEKDGKSDQDDYQKRKRLKKKKKEKHGDRRKKHKHKSCDENCKHKKHHRKHKKHKRHHSRSTSSFNTSSSCEEPPVEEQNQSKDEVFIQDEPQPADKVDTQENIEPEITDIEEEEEGEDIAQQKSKKSKKRKDRQESSESRSKMSAFLPTQQLWSWFGKGYKRHGARSKGKSRKVFYKEIKRGEESIQVGNSAVFLSTARADRPYIGRVQAMWESRGTMDVRVKWFYHPEETTGCKKLKYPGALFESPHTDRNDVQTISHKCDVLPLKQYKERLADDPKRYATIYENNDLYYVAGYYDPNMKYLNLQKGIPSEKSE